MIDFILSDDDIEMTPEEAKALEAIATSDCKDIVGLVRQTSYDIKTFFEFGDWQDVDFRDSDVSGVSFLGANMARSIMYRDQFEAIQRTGPKTLDKARIQEKREGGKSDTFSVFSDRPLDPFEAREDFKRVLKTVMKGFSETNKVDWDRFVPYVSRLDVPLGRLWGLELVLDEFPARLPSAHFLEACAQGFEADAATSFNETSLANKLLAICQADSIDERLKALKSQVPSGSTIEAVLKFKLPDIAKNTRELERVVNFFQDNRWEVGIELFSQVRKVVKQPEEFLPFLELMKKARVQPDRTIFGAFAQRLKNMDDIGPFLKLMEDVEVRPDIGVFSLLAERTNSMEDVRPFLKFMEQAEVRPSTSVFSRLAQRSQSMEDIEPFLELMEQAEVQPSTSVFSTLAERTNSMEDIGPFLKLMEQAGVQPDKTVFSGLAQNTKSMEDIDPFLKLMEKADVPPDNAVFSTLAERSGGIDEFRHFLELMEKTHVKPDSAVFSKLAERVRNMDEVQSLLKLMEDVQVRTNVAVFSKLAERVRNMDEVRQFLKLMEKARVKPDGGVFSNLVPSAKNLIDVKKLRQDMAARNIPETNTHIGVFISACASVEEAEEFLKMYQETGKKPSPNHLNRLLNNTRSATDAEKVWKVFDRFQISRDQYTYNIMINRQDTWEGAWEVYANRRPQRVRPWSHTFSHLLSKVRSREHIQRVFDEMRTARFQPEVAQVYALLKSSSADKDVLWAFSKFRRAGLDLKSIDPDDLGEHAERFKEIVSRLS